MLDIKHKVTVRKNMTKHIAASGKQAGQWVTCPATQQCTLKTTHASDRDIAKTQLWKQDELKSDKKIPAKDITEQDYIKYLQAPIEDKEIYDQMFEDQEKERLKKIRQHHAEAVASNSAWNAESQVREQNPVKRRSSKEKRPLFRDEKADKGDTIVMENGFVVHKANYTTEQKEEAKRRAQEINIILGKWDTAKLSKIELQNFSNYAAGRRIFGTDDNAKRTHKIVMEGLSTPPHNLTKEDLAKFRNAALILERLQNAQQDVIRGYTVGSYSMYVKSVQNPANWPKSRREENQPPKKGFFERFIK